MRYERFELGITCGFSIDLDPHNKPLTPLTEGL